LKSAIDSLKCAQDTEKQLKGTVTGSKLRQALLFKLVLEYVSLVAQVDSRTQKSQRTQRFILVRTDDALRLAADDPYTQKHPKSGLQQSVGRDLVGG
jgi:hypothetical protein